VPFDLVDHRPAFDDRVYNALLVPLQDKAHAQLH
jgi:hypothetical protein